MSDEKRVDDLRQDVQELRREMHASFEQLNERIKDSDLGYQRQSQNKQRYSDKQLENLAVAVEKRFENFDCKLKDQESEIRVIKESLVVKFNELDKKLFRLFFVGNAVGIAVGSVVTMIIQAIIRNAA